MHPGPEISRRPTGPSAPARRRHFSDARGAVLIVALLVSALIALGLAGYLSLNLTSSRLAQRTSQSYAALNLAEAGTEEAVWSFNRASGGKADAWSQWTLAGAAAWQKFTGFDLGRNATGSVKVYVDNHQPDSTARPKIIAQSSVGAPGDTPVTKMIEVTLRRRSSFANGLVAKESIVFSGTNTSVDAWDSDPDRNPFTPPVDFDVTNRTDRGTIATADFSTGAVLLNQASIWGYVATGGAPPQVGPLGSIRGANTPPDVAVDPRRVSTDFNADFSPASTPPDGTFLSAIPATLGVEGTTTRWRALQLSLSGTQTLTILGNVTLILTMTSAGDAISVTGNASIIIPTGSKLTVYTEGAVKIAGQGLLNRNIQPISCQIWGTSDSAAGQDIQVAGNGALRCVVYAPNGNVKINGNGDVMGSIIARSIRMDGNAAFHYDESLAIGQNNEPFAIARWRELTSSADRAPYLPLFEGW